MRNDTYARALSAWAILTNGMRPLLPELPHAQNEFDQLSGALDELSGLNEKVEKLRAELQDATTKRRRLLEEGHATHQTLAAVLQGRFGLASAELIQFGLKPRGRRRKKAPAQDEPVAKGAAEV